MATFTVPCTPTGAAHFTQVTTLDGRDYGLTFRWSQRRGAWTLDVADAAGAAIRSGLALLTNRALLFGLVDARRPPGELFLFDLTDTGGDPGFADLGTRFELVYFDAADAAALFGGATTPP